METATSASGGDESDITHGKLESFDKTDGLLDRAANVEVVDGDLTRGSRSTHTSPGLGLRSYGECKFASLWDALCRVATTM